MSGFFDKTKADMKYLFKKGDTLLEKEKKQKLRAWATVAGIVLVIIQLVMTVLALLKLYKLNILPLKYIVAVDIVLVLIALYDFLSQFTKTHIAGKVISVLLSLILLYTFLFTSKVDETLQKISDVQTTTDTIDVIVLKNDKANSIADTVNYTYGYNSTINTQDNTDTIQKINFEQSANLATKEYSTWYDLVTAFNDNKDIQVIILEDSILSSLDEQFEGFTDTIKIVGTIELKRTVELTASDKKVNEEPFIIYISGNDEEGKIKSTGRSDVNVLCVVNPISRQVLLITTPRDAYVSMTNPESGVTLYDKLTHAGNWGVEGSMSTLENLYDCNIDYFVKVNFTGCVAVVDALGGITIDSEVDFENGWEAAPETYHFKVGENECDGAMTLAFCRERKAFLDGDFQRGRNQLAALTGVINKLSSTAVLSRYSSILNSVGEMILTSMPASDITSLVKGQLADTRGWNIQTFSIQAEPDSLYSPGNGDFASMSKLYKSDVDVAKKLIDKIENGETFDLDEFYEEETKNVTTIEYLNVTDSSRRNPSTSSSSSTQKETQATTKSSQTTTKQTTTTTKETESSIEPSKETQKETQSTTAATEKSTEATTPPTVAPTNPTNNDNAATPTPAAQVQNNN